MTAVTGQLSAAERKLLAEHADPDPRKPGNWLLRTPSGVSRSGEATVAYIRACLYLGVCVTDQLTMEFLITVAWRVSELEARLNRLGGEPPW